MAIDAQSDKDDLLGAFLWGQMLRFDLPDDARKYVEDVIKLYQDRSKAKG